jgi:hydrogenase 3 maturation protease
MDSWKKSLKEALRAARRGIIIGVGNDLKADDGVGPFIIEKLQNQISTNFELINASTVPENFINPIINARPDFVLIVDAALMSVEPGTIRLIDKDTIGGVAFSTHQLPLTFFIEYLHSQLKATILVLGIQPLTDEFGAPLSKPIEKAAREIIELFLSELEPDSNSQD